MLEHCYYRVASVVLEVYRNQFKFVWNRINSSPVLIMSLGKSGSKAIPSPDAARMFTSNYDIGNNPH